jgi:hypothetical protein
MIAMYFVAAATTKNAFMPGKSSELFALAVDPAC